MRKRIKIMDIFCMINCEEEVPYKIRYNGKEYTYESEIQDYVGEDDYLFEYLFKYYETAKVLETEVEILDEFEELNKSDYQYSQCPTFKDKDGIITIMNNNFELHQKAIRDIIDNQKKIIEKLKEME